MASTYNRWNRWIRKALWILTAIGIVASIPLVANRIQMERSANTVEFVVDYRDILDISLLKGDPRAFVREQLSAFREAGVGAMAVYESTIEELETSGAIRILTQEEAAFLTGSVDGVSGNRTFLLFAGEAEREALEPIIREGFALFGISVDNWDFGGKDGLSIEAGSREANIVPLDPNPMEMALINEYGFRIAVRLSDARPYDHGRMDALLARLSATGADTIVFAGKQVTGTKEDKNAMALTGMAELIDKHGFRFAAIEQPMEKQQKGIGKLAELTGYRTFRLHSVLEEESFTDARVLADRYVLAVKDRNIRMIYLNPLARVDKEQSKVENSLHNLLVSLKDPEFGAVERIRGLGFEIGAPEPFDVINPGWERWLKALVMLGAVALIARMIACFLPWLALPVFALGLAGTAGLYVLGPTLCMQALALGASVSAPTAAVIAGMRQVRGLSEKKPDGTGPWRAFGIGLAMFVRTLLLSLVGAVYIVALLNHISYLYVLNQFRGVSVLHLMPIVLVAVYAMFFHGAETFGQVLNNIKRFLFANIKVVWVAAAGAAGVVLLYYMSRTGNEGTVLSIDRAFRAFLEDTFGVRPRTKELLTQPLLVMGFYLFLRHKGRPWIWALAVAGSMGMLSPVDTFAHLHSPVAVSSLRVLYGALVSVGISLVYFAAWEIVVRGWKRWRHKQPSLG